MNCKLEPTLFYYYFISNLITCQAMLFCFLFFFLLHAKVNRKGNLIRYYTSFCFQKILQFYFSKIWYRTNFIQLIEHAEVLNYEGDMFNSTWLILYWSCFRFFGAAFLSLILINLPYGCISKWKLLLNWELCLLIGLKLCEGSI